MRLDPKKFVSYCSPRRDAMEIRHPDKPHSIWIIDGISLLCCDDDWIAALKEMQRRQTERRGAPAPSSRFPATALRQDWKPL